MSACCGRKRAYATPRALDTAEIAGIVAAFRKGAENAKLAGFDGVEIHGANGYLLDQFLQDGTNQRTDAYGGSIENRARLMLEVTDACIAVWGADRVGMHLAPRGDAHDMGDSDPAATFGYVARELGKRGIAFICAREALGDDRLGPQLKQAVRRRLHRQRKDDAGQRAKRCSRRAKPTRSRSASCSSPTRTCRAACDPRRRSTRRARNCSTTRRREGYTDYPAL